MEDIESAMREYFGDGFFEPPKKKTGIIGNGNSTAKGLLSAMLVMSEMLPVPGIGLTPKIKYRDTELRPSKQCMLKGCNKEAEYGKTHCSVEHYKETLKIQKGR